MTDLRSHHSTVDSPPVSDPLQREALAWLARLTSGDATEADADALAAWRTLSPDHEAAFRAAAALWRRLGDAGAAVAVAQDAGDAAVDGRRFVLRRLLVGAAAAAGLAGAHLAGWRLGWLPPLSDLRADYATGRGERISVILPDGSAAELDADTALTLDFTKDRRDVTLIRGTALFDVIRDPARPFAVRAANGATTAIGTRFAVRWEPSRIRVTCVEGVVEVAAATEDRRRLQAGEQTTYDSDGVGPAVAVDPTLATAWRRGLMVFQDQPLADVIADLNRHRVGWVLLADTAPADRRVSGVFHLSRPEEVIDHLRTTLNLQPTRLPGGVLVLR